MALISDLNRHPDEYYHFMVSKYYFNHWIPPRIGDPRVGNTYSCQGISYINQLGVDYFLLGKFGYLINRIIKDEVKSVRFFNVFLFLFILTFSFWRYKNHSESILIFLPLLFTPQIWYVFSYINNDAFPLFLSFIAASEITYRNSLLNKFLDSEIEWNHPKSWVGGIFFGFLLGILSISKMNYYALFLFIGFWFIYKTLQPFHRQSTMTERKNLFLKYFFIVCVAFSIFTMRYGLDILVNGWNRSERVTAYSEEIAQYPFKPSTIKYDAKNAHEGIALKERGFQYTELFSKRNWHKLSFYSLVGVYGYMNIFSTSLYYDMMFYLYGFFWIYLIFAVLIQKDVGNKVLILAVTLFILIMIFISSYHSWVTDFQPQGRYFFPVASIIGLLIYQSRKDLNSFLMHSLTFAIFILSVYSFVTIALKHI